MTYSDRLLAADRETTNNKIRILINSKNPSKFTSQTISYISELSSDDTIKVTYNINSKTSSVNFDIIKNNNALTFNSSYNGLETIYTNNYYLESAVTSKLIDGVEITCILQEAGNNKYLITVLIDYPHSITDIAVESSSS